MISTLLALMELQSKHIFRNSKHHYLQDIIKHKEQEFEKLKNSFKPEVREKIDNLITVHRDYIETVETEEKDNFVILALKIGIELGRYFEQIEDL